VALTGKQRRALRALGHHLEPVVALGKEGLTDALIAAVEQALADHELIKLKVGESSPVDRHEAAEALAEETGAEVAQVLGRTLLLFRRNPEDPKVEVPDMPMPPKAEKAQKRPEAAKAKEGPARKPVAKRPAGKTPAGARRAPRR
jgi:RNA-binding protein